MQRLIQVKRGCFLDNNLHKSPGSCWSDRNILVHTEMDTLLCLNLFNSIYFAPCEDKAAKSFTVKQGIKKKRTQLVKSPWYLYKLTLATVAHTTGLNHFWILSVPEKMLGSKLSHIPFTCYSKNTCFFKLLWHFEPIIKPVAVETFLNTRHSGKSGAAAMHMRKIMCFWKIKVCNLF